MTNTELFNRITDIVPKLEGWCTIDKALDLAATVLTLRPEVSVEIGVFGGKSVIPIALAHSAIGKGQVWAIDPWAANESVKGQNAENDAWWSKLDHDSVHRKFVDAVVQEGLMGQIHIIRDTSDNVKPPNKIDFLHIDGNHGPQAFKDAKRFAPNVRVGGVVFLDDLGWDGGAVGKAAEFLGDSGFIRLYDRDSGAMFQRISFIKPVKSSKK